MKGYVLVLASLPLAVPLSAAVTRSDGTAPSYPPWRASSPTLTQLPWLSPVLVAATVILSIELLTTSASD